MGVAQGSAEPARWAGDERALVVPGRRRWLAGVSLLFGALLVAVLVIIAPAALAAEVDAASDGGAGSSAGTELDDLVATVGRIAEEPVPAVEGGGGAQVSVEAGRLGQRPHQGRVAPRGQGSTNPRRVAAATRTCRCRPPLSRSRAIPASST
jgi:hypothetical protein